MSYNTRIPTNFSITNVTNGGFSMNGSSDTQSGNCILYIQAVNNFTLNFSWLGSGVDSTRFDRIYYYVGTDTFFQTYNLDSYATSLNFDLIRASWINVPNFNYATGVNNYSGSSGNITVSNGDYVVIMYMADATSSTFAISNFANQAGTACFAIHTKILSDLTEIPIENLNVGDMIFCFNNGLIPIKRVIKGTLINGSHNPLHCMFKHLKNDLVVTGGHSLLVDSLTDEQILLSKKLFGVDELPTIDGKFLLLACICDEFQQIDDNNEYEYFHLLLENYGDKYKRYGIWANGLLTETPSEDFLNSVFK